MNRSYLILFLFLFSQAGIAQKVNLATLTDVEIVDCSIKYIETVLAYKPGNSRVYPPSMIPYLENTYKFSLTVRLIGIDLGVLRPLNVKCYFENGEFLNRGVSYPGDFNFDNNIYDFDFMIHTESNLHGEAKVEILKYDSNTNHTQLIFDKIKLFIEDIRR